MKILMLGDSPRLRTGFGRVNLHAGVAFADAGHEVVAVEALMMGKPKPRGTALPFEAVWPIKGDDALATETVRATYRKFRPDLVYLTGEPGSLVSYTRHLPETAKLLTYQFIEGAPIVNSRWRNSLAKVDVIATTGYGAAVIENTTGRKHPWVYSGVDHGVFNVTGLRDDLRKAQRFDGKFVITCVAQNVRRKQVTRLIEAVSTLRYRHKREDLLLYLHMSPFQSHWLEGWNMIEVVQAYGLTDITVFHPGMMPGLHSFVPDRTDSVKYPGLAEVYNMSDLFVLPSQVEGFGLPIAEAMACGLPVLVTKYAGGWEVAQPAGHGIPVNDWEIHKSGARYANVSPDALADQILKLMRTPNELKRMSAAGIARAQDFQWGKFGEVLLSEADRVLSGDQGSGYDRQEEGPGAAPQEKDEPVSAPSEAAD